MTNTKSDHSITEEVIRAALSNPNGWVYKIDGAFTANDDVPPEAIVGAWKVSPRGEIIGEFIVNPDYRPSKQ